MFGAGTQRPAPVGERWLVVGGGPAGLKCAVGLAERGHSVVLHEARDALGGQVGLITRTPGRARLGLLVADLERHLRRLRVTVRLGSKVDQTFVDREAPDAIVIATGAKPSRDGHTIALPLRERIPGVEGGHVLTPWEILDGAEVGSNVVLLEDDGTRYSAGVAEVLLDRGCRVHLITALDSLFPATRFTGDMGLIYKRLLSKGLTYQLGAWLDDIQPTSVTVCNLHTGRSELRTAVDAVVLAGAREPADGLYRDLTATHPRVHRIGDCVAPRGLDHAIYEGFLAGRELWSSAERHIPAGALEAWAEQ